MLWLTSCGTSWPHLNVFTDYPNLTGDEPNATNRGAEADETTSATAHAGDDQPATSYPDTAEAGDTSANHGAGETNDTGTSRGVDPNRTASRSPMVSGWDPFGENPPKPEPVTSGSGLRAWFTDGTPVDEATLRRLACDAGVHRVVRDGRSSILDYGRTTRTIPTNLFNAVIARDRHCRFPGCDRPAAWCEGHHVVPWEHHGRTKLGNLALYCSRHHHHIHAHRWQLTLHPDGTIDHLTPGGTKYTTRPPGLLPWLTEPPPPARAA